MAINHSVDLTSLPIFTRQWLREHITRATQPGSPRIFPRDMPRPAPAGERMEGYARMLCTSGFRDVRFTTSIFEVEREGLMDTVNNDIDRTCKIRDLVIIVESVKAAVRDDLQTMPVASLNARAIRLDIKNGEKQNAR